MFCVYSKLPHHFPLFSLLKLCFSFIFFTTWALQLLSYEIVHFKIFVLFFTVFKISNIGKKKKSLQEDEEERRKRESKKDKKVKTKKRGRDRWGSKSVRFLFVCRKLQIVDSLQRYRNLNSLFFSFTLPLSPFPCLAPSTLAPLL